MKREDFYKLNIGQDLLMKDENYGILKIRITDLCTKQGYETVSFRIISEIFTTKNTFPNVVFDKFCQSLSQIKDNTKIKLFRYTIKHKNIDLQTCYRQKNWTSFVKKIGEDFDFGVIVKIEEKEIEINE